MICGRKNAMHIPNDATESICHSWISMITIGEVSLLFILRSRKITAILTKVALISKYATMEKLTCWAAVEDDLDVVNDQSDGNSNHDRTFYNNK